MPTRVHKLRSKRRISGGGRRRSNRRVYPHARNGTRNKKRTATIRRHVRGKGRNCVKRGGTDENTDTSECFDIGSGIDSDCCKNWSYSIFQSCLQYCEDCLVCNKTKGRPVGMYDCKTLLPDGTKCPGYGDEKNWSQRQKICDLRFISWGLGPCGNFPTDPLFIATAQFGENKWLMFADVLNLSLCHFLIIPCINPTEVETMGYQNIATLLKKQHARQALTQMQYFRNVVYSRIFGMANSQMSMECTIRFSTKFNENIDKFQKRFTVSHDGKTIDDLVMSGFNMPGSEDLVHMQNVVIPWMWNGELTKWETGLHFATPRFIPITTLLQATLPLDNLNTDRCVIAVREDSQYDANKSDLWVKLTAATQSYVSNATTFMTSVQNNDIDRKRGTQDACMSNCGFEGFGKCNEPDHPVQMLCQKGFINPSTMFPE